MMKQLQSLGKSLMLPIAVLPIAAILLRLGVLFEMPFVTKAGGAIFDNLAILFAIGVAVGLSKDGNGAAALAGAVGHFTILFGAQSINPDINMGVFSGIIGGILGAYFYNKYSDIQLPQFLGFFSGRRFVPIITGLVGTLLSGLFGYVWPHIQNGLDAIARGLVNLGPLGTGLFGFFNRLLIPTGLHHVFNSFIWFGFGEYKGADGKVVTGDLSRFFAGDPTAGNFMGGFYPIMMFGLLGLAFAIYMSAPKNKRAAVGGVLVSVGLTSFLTGITEPIEFMFMFISPVLYVIHAILTGLSMALTTMLGIKHGFGFSAGAIDYVLNYNLATKPLMLIVLGIIFFVIYYVIFSLFIKFFKLNIAESIVDDDDNMQKSDISTTEEMNNFVDALGGLDNLDSIDSCITRLRLSVKDNSLIDEAALKKLGSRGVIKPSADTVQVVLGAKAEVVANELKKLKL